MSSPNPALDIQRLNELAATMPAVLTELGILKPQSAADDLISFPASTGFNLRKISTGQASLFHNTTLRLECWTTPAFDFNGKEWAHNVALDASGRGEIDGITVTLSNGVCVLRSGADTLQLPPFAKTYANNAPLVANVIGNTRFSVRPGRQSWATGKMVWL